MHEYVAEIGTSHGGSLSKAKLLIDHAKDCGVNTVKFQWIIPHEIVSPLSGKISPIKMTSAPSINIYNYFQSVERPKEFYADIKHYAESCGLNFLCSVFGLESLEGLLSLSPDRIKIASPEINHIPLLREIAKQNITVVISSGLASLIDIYRALTILQQGNIKKITLIRCVTQYPASPASYAIPILKTYASLFKCDVGISDHTQDPTFLPALATAFGSSMTEKHFRLPIADKKEDHSPDDLIALSPKEFYTMIQETSKISSAYEKEGNSGALAELKAMYGTERIEKILCDTGATHSSTLLPHYFTSRRSLFAKKDIAQGELLAPENIILLRSEHNTAPGIVSENYDSVLYKKSSVSIQKEHPIRYEHIAAFS